jgi:preprotein translocase subunit YajC
MKKGDKVKIIDTGLIGEIISISERVPFPIEVMFDNGKSNNFKYGEIEELNI